MSDELNWPVNAPPETETLRDENLLGSYAPLSTLPGKKQRKTTFLQFRNWIASKIASGAMLLNPRSFTAGRFDSKELASGTLSVSGWYTIAETGIVPSKSFRATFSCEMFGNGLSFIMAVKSHNIAKDRNNSTVKIIDIDYRSTGTNFSVQSARLAKSDSVSTSGFKVQVLIDATVAAKLTTQLSQNLGSDAGFVLVAPTQTDINLLPDGVTIPTFLEAGAEFDLDIEGLYPIGATKLNDDQAFIIVQWPETPKQGTGITITLPSTALTLRNDAGTTATISGAHTTSSFGIKGRIVKFIINEVGAFAALPITFTLLGFRVAGTGCKLTII